MIAYTEFSISFFFYHLYFIWLFFLTFSSKSPQFLKIFSKMWYLIVKNIQEHNGSVIEQSQEVSSDEQKTHNMKGI